MRNKWCSNVVLFCCYCLGQSLPQPQLVHLQSVQVQAPPEPQPQSWEYRNIKTFHCPHSNTYCQALCRSVSSVATSGSGERRVETDSEALCRRVYIENPSYYYLIVFIIILTQVQEGVIINVPITRVFDWFINLFVLDLYWHPEPEQN